MIRNCFLVLGIVTFFVIGATKGDTIKLQKTVEHLVNYTTHAALEQLDLDDIGSKLVDAAYKNYSEQGKPSYVIIMHAL